MACWVRGKSRQSNWCSIGQSRDPRFTRSQRCPSLFASISFRSSRDPSAATTALASAQFCDPALQAAEVGGGISNHLDARGLAPVVLRAQPRRIGFRAARRRFPRRTRDALRLAQHCREHEVAARERSREDRRPAAISPVRNRLHGQRACRGRQSSGNGRATSTVARWGRSSSIRVFAMPTWPGRSPS